MIINMVIYDCCHSAGMRVFKTRFWLVKNVTFINFVRAFKSLSIPN